jgi:hypothetical protein
MLKKGHILSLIFLFTILFCLTNYSIAQSREYLIKAAYIEKFTRFIEWPANSLDGEFVITILGKDPFEGALEEIARKYKIKNLPIIIKYISDIDEIEKCNILFIAQSKKNTLNEIFYYTKDKPILTLSETKNYGEKGVHINFYYTNKGTIHFEVNPAKLKKSGFTMDMYLLELGKIIGE